MHSKNGLQYLGFLIITLNMKSSLISNCSKFLSISLSFHTLYIAYDKIAMLQRSSNICSYCCTCIISHEYMFVNIYLNINISFYRSTHRSSHTSLNNVKFQSKKGRCSLHRKYKIFPRITHLKILCHN